MNNIQSDILDELAANIDHYRSITAHLRKHREDSFNTIDKIFHDDIIDGYKVIVSKVIKADMARRFSWDYEAITIALEDVDLAGILE